MKKFTLELSAAKNIDYIEKYFKGKLQRIKFPTKNSVDACLYLPLKWSYGAPKIGVFEILYYTEMEENLRSLLAPLQV